MEVGVDAYASVEEVTAYLSARGVSTTWEAADDPAKEAAIIEATSFLDASFKWVGRIEDVDQSLGWPRLCAYDREGRLLSDIPAAVKNATAELSNIALGGRLQAPQLAAGTPVKRERVGDVEMEYDGYRADPSYDAVKMILRGIGTFLSANSGTIKLVRT